MVAVPDAPKTPPLELERLRRSVKSRLFDREQEMVRIGRFKVLGCLGEGGMGIVYAALDEELNRKVAIKLLRPELSAGGGADRLASEAQSLAQLSHPNVVSVFDVGTHDGQRFIAMEYVEGQTLREWLRTPRELSETLGVFVEAGRGLAAAHAVGLVHRDFKPDNVLVGSDGRPRILDFGLARAPDPVAGNPPPSLEAGADPMATSLTVDGAVLGTPAFMAPEQHLGDPADTRSDVFAYCVSLYQAVYGALPFRGGDLRSLSLAIVRGRLPPEPEGSNVPPAVRALLERGLQVDPSRRFSTMDEVLGELQAVRLTTGERAPAVRPTLGSDDVEQALGEAARLEQVAASNPGLTPTEVVQIASEAGLSPGLARKAVERVIAPSDTETRAASALPVRAPGAPPERNSLGFETVIGLHRSLSQNLTGQVAVGVIRELEREFGEKGHAEWIGSSLVWTGPTGDARLDPTATGTVELRIRRDRHKEARTRRKRGMLGLGIGGFFFGLIVADAVGMPGDMDLLLAINTSVVGLASGFFGARALHNRAIGDDRAQLDYLAERIEGLLAATPSPALAPGPSS